jgi:hypothetical protein
MPNKEGVLHHTPRTTVTCELAARLCSVGILYALGSSLSNKDGANNVSDNPDNGLAHHHATMMVEGIMQSLTCAKGNVLSQTLLLPWDCRGWGGDALVCSRSCLECHWRPLQC